MLIAQIVNSLVEFVDQPQLTTEILQRLVGGPLEAAFVLRDPFGQGDVVGYVNARGMGLRPNCTLDGQTIHGPLMIVGVGPAGEHRDLTREELDAITLEAPDHVQVPALTFVGTGDGA